MLHDILLALGIRFFLFDFILFKKIRDNLKKRNYVFKKLFSCTFCQGFWCGLFISLARNPLFPLLSHLEFAFVSAITSFTWTVAMNPLISQFEKNNDLPMT